MTEVDRAVRSVLRMRRVWLLKACLKLASSKTYFKIDHKPVPGFRQRMNQVTASGRRDYAKYDKGRLIV